METKESLQVFALGYANKKGMIIKSLDGGQINIKSVKIGNMSAPDAHEFNEKFLEKLGNEDVVLTPNGPNHTYIAGCASKCKVLWLHTNRLQGSNGKIHEELFRIYRENPESFYEYQAAGIKIQELGIMVKKWMGLEQQLVADANAYSQALKREQDFFNYFKPDREQWVSDFVTREVKKETSRLKKRGVKLNQEQVEKMTNQTRNIGYEQFDQRFGESDKDQAKARAKAIAQHLEWFGVDELLEHTEKETKKFVQTLPENRLFDGLISEGTFRVRAQILAYMRNPLLYPNVRALLAYADVGGIGEGQVIQRRHGQTEHGNPKFRKTLCFDFAEKYWQNDTVGFFRDLYYAIKAHQYYLYWDLIELTSEVFKTLGKKDTDEEKTEGNGQNNETDEIVKSDADIGSIIERLKSLVDLPIIKNGPSIKKEIEALTANPDPKRLWKLFSRAGFNLQMTPKRVEQQIKRLLGITLLKAVYYRWLESMKMPLPLSDDPLYIDQFQYLSGKKEIPAEFNHLFVLFHYRKRAAMLKAERTASLPADIELKFVPPSEREMNEI